MTKKGVALCRLQKKNYLCTQIMDMFTENPTVLDDLYFQWEFLLVELAETLGKKPDLQAILFLIGIQESGQSPRKFKKEEKQDLMHVAVCHLLSKAGYFELIGRDEDGWPHYRTLQSLPTEYKGLVAEEVLLKTEILRYFEKI